jgi:hypothetical protein
MGRPGSWGSSGTLGQATLIPQMDPVAPATPALSIDMGSLGATNSYPLSDNRWRRQSGALSLFAPGSELADTYTLYAGRVERTATIKWAADRPASDFASETLSLRLNGDNSLSLSVDDATIWTDIRETDQAGGRAYTIDRVVRASEASNLKFLGISGKDTGLVARFQDLNGLNSVVRTAVHVKYETAFMYIFYLKKFEGDVPADLLTIDHDVITVALGKLPIKAKYLAAGERIRLTFEVGRSFLGNSTNFEVKKARERIGN